MKFKVLNPVVSGILAASIVNLAVATSAEAGHVRQSGEHKVIKVLSELDKEVSVIVKNEDGKNRYSFDKDELGNLDNIRAELGDLDEETLEKVMSLLAKLEHHDEKFIELKDLELTHGDKHTEMYVIKKGDNEDNLHLEVDIEGDGADPDNHFRVAKILGKTLGDHHVIHHKVKQKKGPHTVKMLRRLIKKAELTPEEVEELKQMLDDK